VQVTASPPSLPGARASTRATLDQELPKAIDDCLLELALRLRRVRFEVEELEDEQVLEDVAELHRIGTAAQVNLPRGRIARES
jgi:hypothetical protein